MRNTATRIAAVLLCAVMVEHMVTASSSSWVECTSNFDCSPSYCCVISAHERYSYPRCQKLHEEGDYCRPGGPTIANGSRNYPGKAEIILDEVYMMFCPCAPGLVCDRDEKVCRHPTDMKDFNYLNENGFSNKKDD